MNRLLMNLFTLFLLYLGNLDADVTHTGQDFSFHIMSDGYVYGIALMHLIDVDREVILIVADTLSFAHAVFVSLPYLSCIRQASFCFGDKPSVLR